jgi:teichuronic acid biosynthesis glycosyltransferase TuaG
VWVYRITYRLEKQLRFIKQKNFPFTFAAYQRIDERRRVLGHVGVPAKTSCSDLLKLCSIGCLTAIYDAYYFGKVYMLLICKREDFGLWLQLFNPNNYASGLNITVTQHRVSNGCISANRIKVAISTWCL